MMLLILSLFQLLSRSYLSLGSVTVLAFSPLFHSTVSSRKRTTKTTRTQIQKQLLWSTFVGGDEKAKISSSSSSSSFTYSTAFQNSEIAKNVQSRRTTRAGPFSSSSSDNEERPTANQNSQSSIRWEVRPQSTKVKSITARERKTDPLSLSYESALKVLQIYHSQHKNLVLPRRYIVPCQDPYPPEWHGIDLSSTIYTMKWWQRNVRYFPNRVADLNTLGFLWERLQPEWNLILEALITYYNIHGTVRVPISFVVPSGNDDDAPDDHHIFPPATWGIPLGRHVHRMRTRHDFLKGPKGAARRMQLKQLGFVWDVNDYMFDKFCAALHHYIRLHSSQNYNSKYNGNSSQKGNGSNSQNGIPSSASSFSPSSAIRIPSTFVVPIQDETWPRGLWGYPLGAKCVAVRQTGLYVRGNPARQERLDQLGFSWKGNASRGWYQVVHAAAIYSQLHHRILDVPQAYRVPRPPWQNSKVKKEMSTKQIITSDIMGPTTSVLETEWPWPESLWDFPLGQRLKDIRQKGAYLKGSDGPSRKAQLDALGFVWNPKRGRRTL
jgi:Helicase associated domain